MLNAAVNASVHEALGETGLGSRTMRQLRLYLQRQSGATAVEYALLCGLLGLAIISGATLVGQAVSGEFTQSASVITGASAGS
jgi:Flp pilus assembly pilin Flp